MAVLRKKIKRFNVITGVLLSIVTGACIDAACCMVGVVALWHCAGCLAWRLMSSSLQNFFARAPRRGVATPGAFTRDGCQAG